MKNLSTITRNIGRSTEQSRMARMARKAGRFCVPVEPKVAFVVRISSIDGVSRKVQKVLQLLCLHQIKGTFVKLNKASMNMLRIVELYIAWGTQTKGQ